MSVVYQKMAQVVFTLTFCLFFVPASSSIPSVLQDDLSALLKIFKVRHLTEIYDGYGSNLQFLGCNSRQQGVMSEQAVTQELFVNHMKCEDIWTASSALGAVFYPAALEDQPCDLVTTEMLVAGSSVTRPLFLFSFEETLIPQWLHEIYVPFKTSVNVILQDKRYAGWLSLQEVYHLDENGTQLVVNQLGKREVDTSKKARWRLADAELRLARRANLHGTKIKTIIGAEAMQDTASAISLFLLKANKTMALACDCLNASVEQQLSPRYGLNELAGGGADIAVYPVTLSAESNLVEYTVPYNSLRHRIYIRKPVFVYSMQSVIQNFPLTLWAMIGVTMVTLSAAMTLANRLALDREPRACWSENLLHTVGSACAQGWSRLPDTKSGRCLLLSTVITGYLLNTYFVIELQSSLSAQTASLPFKGLDELVETDYQIYAHPYGLPAYAIRAGKTEVTRKAKKKSITEEHKKLNLEDVHFCQRRIALIAGTSVLHMFANKVNCTLVDTKADLFLSTMSFPTVNGYQFKELVDYAFRRSVEGGLVQRNERLAQELLPDADQGEDFKVIELDKVVPFFLLHGASIIISLLILALEVVSFNWNTFWKKVTCACRKWRLCAKS